MRARPKPTSRRLDVRVTGDLGDRRSASRLSTRRCASASLRSPPFGKLSVDTTTCAGPEQWRRPGVGALHRRGRDHRYRPDRHLRVGRQRGDAAERRRGALQCQREGGEADDLATATVRPHLDEQRDRQGQQQPRLREALQHLCHEAAGQGVAGATGVGPVCCRCSTTRVRWRSRLGAGWAPIAPPVQCVNEDTNFNGVLDSGDNNQNMDGNALAGTVGGVHARQQWRDRQLRVRRTAGAARSALRLRGRSIRSRRARRPPVPSAPTPQLPTVGRRRRMSTAPRRPAFA